MLRPSLRARSMFDGESQVCPQNFVWDSPSSVPPPKAPDFAVPSDATVAVVYLLPSAAREALAALLTTALAAGSLRAVVALRWPLKCSASASRRESDTAASAG